MTNCRHRYSERVTRIELAPSTWKDEALPLCNTRKLSRWIVYYHQGVVQIPLSTAIILPRTCSAKNWTAKPIPVQFSPNLDNGLRSAMLQSDRRLSVCSPNWTRTNDISVNSGTLYQLSYRGLFSYEMYSNRFSMFCLLSFNNPSAVLQ
jgi:hypothetical protein